MIFIVEQNSFVVFGAVIFNNSFFFGPHQHFQNISLTILQIMTNFNFMHSVSLVLRGEETLLDDQFGIFRCVVRIPFSFKQIERWSLQPHLFPLLEAEFFHIEIFLHLCQEIINCCIFPFVFMEILAQSLPEIFLSHEIEKLFHSCCSFGIRNSIENGISYTCVDDLASDRMGCDHLVLVVASAFSREESWHWRLVADCLEIVLQLLEEPVGNEGSEGFIQPKIIPPPHGDQISKPMMRQLMRNSGSKSQHPFHRHFVLEKIEVVEGDNSRIFHSTPTVLMHKNLVVFVEGKGIVEILLVEFHGLNCDLEDEWGQSFQRFI